MSKTMDRTEFRVLLRPRLLVVAVCLMALVAIYWSTLMSMVDIWERSETFTHGYFIFPIGLYLIWENRKQLAAQAAISDWRALIPLLGLGLLWYVARLVSVIVVEQLAFVLMIPVLVWLICGFRVLRSITFPMAFLVFAVPMGEFLITPMMNMTAVFVIEAVRLTGIPIYAEGTFFSLPSGDWSVVEGCSGVRYLIASVTLGTLYAYLNYSSYRKRVLFILASFVVPVVANWLRAFIIVMLGHFSDMTIATGVDHLIYGWFFFGIVIFLLFWVGSYWRDDFERIADKGFDKEAGIEGGARWAGVTVAGMGVLILWPWLQYQSSLGGLQAITLPQTLPVDPAWSLSNSPFTEWQPRYVNPTQIVRNSYSSPQGPVGVSLQYYASQQQDSELINSQNVMVEQKHPVWRQLSQESRMLTQSGAPESVWETHLNSHAQDLLIWHWHEIGGVRVSNEYQGKLVQAYQQLFGSNAEGVAYIIYTPVDGDRTKATQRLQAFMDANIVRVRSELGRLFESAGKGVEIASGAQD